MRNPNGDGSAVKLGGNRKKPFAVRITTGYTDDGKQIYKYLSYHANRNEALLVKYLFSKLYRYAIGEDDDSSHNNQ